MFAEINSKCYAAVINFFAFEFLSEFRFPTPTETNIVAPNKKLAFFYNRLYLVFPPLLMYPGCCCSQHVYYLFVRDNSDNDYSKVP